MDELWKQHLEDINRLTRLGGPLIEFQSAAQTAQSQLSSFRADHLEEINAQLKALSEPLGHVPDWIVNSRIDQEISNQILALTKPFGDLRAQIQAIVPPVAFKDEVEALLKPFDGARIWFDSYLAEEEAKRKQWSTLLDGFSRQFEGLSDEIREQLAVLLARGWCLDPNMPHTWGRDLVEAIEQGEEDEAQRWLMDYFRQRLGEIEQALHERHASRSVLIADAFKAHREGRYGLSIPVLIAQADGVIYDRHRRQLYSKKSKTNLKDVLAMLPNDDMRAMIVAAFYVDIPLTRCTQQLPTGFDGLNRHAVLHGTDVAYGTEVNGLRAVSILNLASYLVTEEPDDGDA